MHKHTYVAIMAGGIGSRFWPVSRAFYPKQFLDILGSGRTLIQQTFDRFTTLIPVENIFVITSEEYIGIVEEQLPQLPVENIIGEPSRKNTAPCIAYISFKLRQMDSEASLIVVPSDHLILNEVEFLSVCNRGLEFCKRKDALITIGIKPTYANTGYGYIQHMQNETGSGIYKVKNFTEKPDRFTAEQFIQSGDFLWNAGIFIWQVNKIIESFRLYMPSTFELFDSNKHKLNIRGEADVINDIYSMCTNISIDVGILEKADNVYVIPSSFGWSDLGTWNSAWENMNKDKFGNATVGGNVVTVETTKCVVRSYQDKLVLLKGLHDYIVVDTNDALLICPKENEQEIKNYLNEIKKVNGDKFL